MESQSPSSGSMAAWCLLKGVESGSRLGLDGKEEER